MKTPFEDCSPEDFLTQYAISQKYAQIQIDLDRMFSSYEALESYLRCCSFMNLVEAYPMTPDFDLNKALALSKQFSLEEWAGLLDDDIESYNEGPLRYGSLCRVLKTIGEEWRRSLYFVVKQIRTEMNLMYIISGQTDWETEKNSIDMFAIYERLLATTPDTTESNDLFYEYLEGYWEQLTKKSPLNREVFYAFHYAPKEEGQIARHEYPIRGTFNKVRPAKGHLYYFDTEAERDAFVGTDFENKHPLYDAKELLELQWKCTDAVKYVEGAYQHTIQYVLTLGSDLYAIYDELEEAKAAEAMFPYSNPKIQAVPYVQRVDVKAMVEQGRKDVEDSRTYTTEEMKILLGLK